MANERVVVVDDDADVLENLLRGLRVFGIEALGATHPEEALKLFESNQCDVLVVDYVLGSSTGVELMESVKRLRSRTKTILISGYIDHSKLDEQDLTRDLQARVGCEYYLQKPFANEQLVAAVKASIAALDDVGDDWQAIAKQYVAGARLRPEEVRELNEKIKANLKVLDERDERG